MEENNTPSDDLITFVRSAGFHRSKFGGRDGFPNYYNFTLCGVKPKGYDIANIDALDESILVDTVQGLVVDFLKAVLKHHKVASVKIEIKSSA